MVEYVKRFAPKIYADNDTIKNLYSIQQEEMMTFETETKNVINNNFISSSNLNGIKNYELILDIIPNAERTLEERKNECLNKMLYKPPFTKQRLQSILENIWGAGNYNFEIIPDEFKVIIDIATINPIIYLNFQKNVRNIVPSNMYLIFSIQYTYLYLNRNFKYNQLQQFTYEELSQYSEV